MQKSRQNECKLYKKTDVYITALPNGDPIGTVLCPERMAEILSVSHEGVRREKYFVWKLLTYAIKSSLGINEDELHFVKETNGAWSHEGFYFSLSHSSGAIAVAVSDSPVGIDIEVQRDRTSGRLAERIMTGDELLKYDSLPEGERISYLTGAWTKKEAVFKSRGLSSFIPSDYDTESFDVFTDGITLGKEEYVFSVASDPASEIRVFGDIDPGFTK